VKLVKAKEVLTSALILPLALSITVLAVGTYFGYTTFINEEPETKRYTFNLENPEKTVIVDIKGVNGFEEGSEAIPVNYSVFPSDSENLQPYLTYGNSQHTFDFWVHTNGEVKGNIIDLATEKSEESFMLKSATHIALFVENNSYKGSFSPENKDNYFVSSKDGPKKISTTKNDFNQFVVYMATLLGACGVVFTVSNKLIDESKFFDN
jgi:hypothetical protein